MFRSAVDRAGIDYLVDVVPLPEPVYVDRDMWEKIVLNLLSNALKFTFQGRITVALRRAGADGGRSPSPTPGTGVPAEEVPRLFERFHRVERAKARSGEGSGIGLAVVRELIGLHGGTITVDSAPQRGTTFRSSCRSGHDHLPSDRVAPTATERGVSAVEPFVAEALRWLPDGEPEAAGRRRPVGACQAAGCSSPTTTPTCASTSPVARAALRGRGGRATAPRRSRLRADPPDLVVSDVMMPGLDGMELLAALRADQRTARVPVVLLSARAGQEAAVEGLAAGADDYLVKPFSARELLARVGAHVELGRVRREAEERFRAMADLAPALIWVAAPDRPAGLPQRRLAGVHRPGDDDDLGAAGRAPCTPTTASGTSTPSPPGSGEPSLGGRVPPPPRRRRLPLAARARGAPRCRPTPPGGSGAAPTSMPATGRLAAEPARAVGAGPETERGPRRGSPGWRRVDGRLADLSTVRLVGDDGRLRVVGAAGRTPSRRRSGHVTPESPRPRGRATGVRG